MNSGDKPKIFAFIVIQVNCSNMIVIIHVSYS